MAVRAIFVRMIHGDQFDFPRVTRRAQRLSIDAREPVGLVAGDTGCRSGVRPFVRRGNFAMAARARRDCDIGLPAVRLMTTNAIGCARVLDVDCGMTILARARRRPRLMMLVTIGAGAVLDRDRGDESGLLGVAASAYLGTGITEVVWRVAREARVVSRRLRALRRRVAAAAGFRRFLRRFVRAVAIPAAVRRVTRVAQLHVLVTPEALSVRERRSIVHVMAFVALDRGVHGYERR
jgi:hypothetical protein